MVKGGGVGSFDHVDGGVVETPVPENVEGGLDHQSTDPPAMVAGIHINSSDMAGAGLEIEVTDHGFFRFRDENLVPVITNGLAQAPRRLGNRVRRQDALIGVRPGSNGGLSQLFYIGPLCGPDDDGSHEGCSFRLR